MAQAHTARSERTRASILAQAEKLFADKGFAATRLVDVAERVGIRRASIVYYFRDKRELYDAVLHEIVHAFLARLEPIFAEPRPLHARVEAAVSAFVDYVAARPTFARIVLREIADAKPGETPAIVRHTAPYAELIRRVRNEIDGAPPRFPKAEPVQLASAIAGMTIFYMIAVPVIVPVLQLDPLDPARIESLKAELRRIARRLLGESSRAEEGK